MRRAGLMGTALAVACALVLVACGGTGSEGTAGMVRDPAPRVDVAALPDASSGGTPMRFRAADGGLLLVYFGYTLCPDVCPTTMSDLRLALGDLDSEERARIRVAVVTVDPDRDTPAILRDYVRSFVPDGHALRTDDAALLARVARAFGAGYGVTETDHGTIEVSHTAFTYAVDDQGRLVLQWPFGTRWEDIRDDVETLLDDEESASGAARTTTSTTDERIER